MNGGMLLFATRPCHVSMQRVVLFVLGKCNRPYIHVEIRVWFLSLSPSGHKTGTVTCSGDGTFPSTLRCCVVEVCFSALLEDGTVCLD